MFVRYAYVLLAQMANLTTWGEEPALTSTVDERPITVSLPSQTGMPLLFSETEYYFLVTVAARFSTVPLKKMFFCPEEPTWPPNLVHFLDLDSDGRK